MYISPTDRLYPHRTAILLNPHGGRLRRQADTFRAQAAAIPNALVRETNSLAGLDAGLAELAGLGVDHLVVAGGDGTLQAVLDRIIGNERWPALPMFGIIPGGTTNMTAIDIGAKGSPLRRLTSLNRTLSEQGSFRLVTRHVLKISQGDAAPVYGMFFGAGLVAHGAGYFQHRIKRTGLTGESASALAIVRMLAGLFGGRHSGEWAPARIHLSDDGGARPDEDCMLLLASTLDRLLLGVRPYWGPGEGPIHTTCIRSAPRRFWLSLLKIVCGRGAALEIEDGYYSRQNDVIELHMDEPYIIDGEFYRSEQRHGPLRITTAGPLRFLVP